jgi:hypothetical protein
VDDDLPASVDRVAAATGFAGVVRVDRSGREPLARAYGLARRGTRLPNLGRDLPLVDDRVTVEHLLAHRSGIGDHPDEEAGGSATDHVLPVPVHLLADTEDYLAVLDGHPQVSVPGERFAYDNGGFVVLALVAERRGTGRATAWASGCTPAPERSPWRAATPGSRSAASATWARGRRTPCSPTGPTVPGRWPGSSPDA